MWDVRTYIYSYVQYVCTVRMYSTHMYSTYVQYVCTVRMYSTRMYSTYVQYTYVQYTYVQYVCTVRMYSMYVCTYVLHWNLYIPALWGQHYYVCQIIEGTVTILKCAKSHSVIRQPPNLTFFQVPLSVGLVRFHCTVEPA